MHIIACIKQVADTETKIKIKPDRSGVDSAGIKWIISPYDELGVEEALRVKEKMPGSTVTVLSAGPVRVQEALRKALAMGADQAIHVDLSEDVDTFLTAKALALAIKKQGEFHLIFAGREAIDDGASQVSQLISVFLGIPSTAIVLNAQYTENNCLCKREIEGGNYEMVRLTFPALLSVQKGINEARYPNVQNMMQARKKPITTFTLADLGLSDKEQKIRFVQYELPAPKAAGKKIPGEPQAQIKELVRLLHEEAKVI